MKKLLAMSLLLGSIGTASANTTTADLEVKSFSQYTVTTDILRNLIGQVNAEVKTNIGSSALVGAKFMNYNISSDYEDGSTFRTTGSQYGVNAQYHFNNNINADGWITKLSVDRVDIRTDLERDASGIDAFATGKGYYTELLAGYQWKWTNVSSHLLIGTAQYNVDIDAEASDENTKESLSRSASGSGLGLSYGFSYTF